MFFYWEFFCYFFSFNGPDDAAPERRENSVFPRDLFVFRIYLIELGFLRDLHWISRYVSLDLAFLISRSVFLARVF